MSGFHLCKKLPCTAYHLCRKSCQLRNINAVAFVYSATDYLSQEADVSTVLVYGDTVILHAFKFVFKTDKLMIMGSKKSLASQLF